MTALNPETLAAGLVRIGHEAIAKENDAALDDYFAQDHIFHGPDGDAELDDLKRVFAARRTAWTGFTCEHDAFLVQRNMVAARTRMEGISLTES